VKQGDHLSYGHPPEFFELLRRLKGAISITRTVITSLEPGLEQVALSSAVNPPHWEFGHVVWFHEFWIHRGGLTSNPSILLEADQLFNSSEIIHDDRWSARLPTLDVLLTYFDKVMQKTCEILGSEALSPEQNYFIQLAICHQDMHNEAFAYMWQGLGYSWPISVDLASVAKSNEFSEPVYIDFPAGPVSIGSKSNSGFIFDNEKWEQELHIPGFTISSQAVTNQQYLEFIEAHLRGERDHVATLPSHWRKVGHIWQERCFDRWRDMEMHHPVRHISAKAADAYCSWRGLRLPTEPELTAAMSLSPIGWQPSDLWEWTSSPFMPFEGFSPDPYGDYSQPWFDGKHRVLKGWSIFTPQYLRRPQFRNFYLPSRSNPFCGFRTCLL
jgi:ergothioneine biosynthesis protein EgtB